MSFMYPIADHNSQLIHSQLSTEGILWFSNLTLSDPYLVLPFLTAVVNLTIVQVIVSQLMDKLLSHSLCHQNVCFASILHSNERLRKMEKKTKMHAILTNSARGLSVALIPIGLVMPASVCWYWFVSSTMGLCQTWVLHSKAFRQHIGVQSTHTNTN
ncbi:unnamed protein product [Oppiella nova]|uniref:Uncharacterized protein n=1 Tax=Oppiella nova TaxID=334625 RepID=A0A7R9MEN7_9ACAR|nr:unnamed protein product [Oppiella nova]CAG2175940.1 unnamed protein product [Oppiella nova]